jgi:hypothetical protein
MHLQGKVYQDDYFLQKSFGPIKFSKRISRIAAVQECDASKA